MHLGWLPCLLFLYSSRCRGQACRAHGVGGWDPGVLVSIYVAVPSHRAGCMKGSTWQEGGLLPPEALSHLPGCPGGGSRWGALASAQRRGWVHQGRPRVTPGDPASGYKGGWSTWVACFLSLWTSKNMERARPGLRSRGSWGEFAFISRQRPHGVAFHGWADFRQMAQPAL